MSAKNILARGSLQGRSSEESVVLLELSMFVAIGDWLVSEGSACEGGSKEYFGKLVILRRGIDLHLCLILYKMSNMHSSTHFQT